MKFIFEVLVEVDRGNEYAGFTSRDHAKDYDYKVEAAVADALDALEVDLDTSAEECFEGIDVAVTVNKTVEDWS
jgi:hypothetical protein